MAQQKLFAIYEVDSEDGATGGVVWVTFDTENRDTGFTQYVSSTEAARRFAIQNGATPKNF